MITLKTLPACWISPVTHIIYSLVIRKKADNYWKISYESKLPDPETTHISVEGSDLQD